MAAKRGKSQARRNGGNSGGLPGWAWLVLGIVLTLAVILMAPKFMKPGGGDGFFRPKPNPDAKPAPTSDGDDESIAGDGDGDGDAPPAPATKTDAKPKPTQYDFYTMLPGDEVQMSDAEIAATAREEAARQATAQAAAQRNDAASPAANVEQPTNPLQSTATHARNRCGCRCAVPAAGRRIRCIGRRGSHQGQGRAARLERTRGIGAAERQDRLPRAHGSVFDRVRTGRGQAKARQRRPAGDGDQGEVSAGRDEQERFEVARRHS